MYRGRLNPDEAVILGRDSVFIPYIDPGVELAKAFKQGVDDYAQKHGEIPKVIYMESHGVTALGGSAKQTQGIMEMAVKAARVRLGAIQAGGIKTLPTETINHLLGRPDEHYRMALFK